MISLKFNEKACIRDFRKAALALMAELTDQLMAEVVSRSPTAEIRASLDSTLKQTGDTIRGRVFAANWKALLFEWGSGTAMDTSNPALMNYIMGDLWNPARPRQGGAPIVGRPPGPYTGLDGQTHVSSGSAEGKNLEPMYGRVEPTHFMTRAVEEMGKRIESAFADFLTTFPFGQYIKGVNG